MKDVIQVETDALAKCEVIASLNLGEAGDTGAHHHSSLLCGGCKIGHLLRDPRSGADEAHVAFEDVDEFGEFVERS